MGTLMLGRKSPSLMTGRQKRWFDHCLQARRSGKTATFESGVGVLQAVPATSWRDANGAETIVAVALVAGLASEPLCVTYFRNDGSVTAYEDKRTGDVFEFERPRPARLFSHTRN